MSEQTTAKISFSEQVERNAKAYYAISDALHMYPSAWLEPAVNAEIGYMMEKEIRAGSTKHNSDIRCVDQDGTCIVQVYPDSFTADRDVHFQLQTAAIGKKVDDLKARSVLAADFALNGVDFDVSKIDKTLKQSRLSRGASEMMGMLESESSRAMFEPRSSNRGQHSFNMTE